jgi:hypothetical protein
MVNVDTVYQRVLAIANKEQRGYITPLEFNLLANQAQLEIFESYFTELNQALTMPGNNSEYSDIVTTLNEKIGKFVDNTFLTKTGEYFTYPSNAYKLGTSDFIKGVEIQEVDYNEILDYNKSPLTKPKLSNPLFVHEKGRLKVFPSSISVGVKAVYTRVPNKVTWGYVVVNEQALYNAGSSQDFELHVSEEITLVMKILGLAGIVIQRQELVALGQQQA